MRGRRERGREEGEGEGGGVCIRDTENGKGIVDVYIHEDKVQCHHLRFVFSMVFML